MSISPGMRRGVSGFKGRHDLDHKIVVLREFTPAGRWVAMVEDTYEVIQVLPERIESIDAAISGQIEKNLAARRTKAAYQAARGTANITPEIQLMNVVEYLVAETELKSLRELAAQNIRRRARKCRAFERMTELNVDELSAVFARLSPLVLSSAKLVNKHWAACVRSVVEDPEYLIFCVRSGFRKSGFLSERVAQHWVTARPTEAAVYFSVADLRRFGGDEASIALCANTRLDADDGLKFYVTRVNHPAFRQRAQEVIERIGDLSTLPFRAKLERAPQENGAADVMKVMVLDTYIGDVPSTWVDAVEEGEARLVAISGSRTADGAPLSASNIGSCSIISMRILALPTKMGERLPTNILFTRRSGHVPVHSMAGYPPNI